MHGLDACTFVIVTVGNCISVCVCVFLISGWWRQLVGPRLPFHPKDHTEKDRGRRVAKRLGEMGRRKRGELEKNGGG